MSRLKKGAAGAMAAAVAIVGTWEGLRLKAYRDVIGIATVCYGETRGVQMDDEYTREECDSMLAARLAEFDRGISACLVHEDTIPDKTYAAFVSLAYNVGTAAFCSSTLARKANAGDLVGACNELPRWNRAGGRIIRGLVNRREAEQRLCYQGILEAVALRGSV